jgi:hypothetical protein
MGLGSNSGSPRIFLSVGFGKIRQKSLENKEKVTSTTPNAVKRLKQDNTETWAIEHDYISGKIENIFFKEDEKYGNSFEVVLLDGIDKYQISFSEDNRFWFDFMKKLPNVLMNDAVKITAYDFVDKKTGKRKAGISLEQNGNKITSFYDKKKDETTWELLHGFPKSDGIDWKDKDELKIYFIRVKKFLHNEFNTRIAPLFELVSEKHNIEVEDNSNDVGPVDDLPF